MPLIKPSRQPLFAPTVLALSLALVGAPAQAADRYWTFITGCGSADWFGKTNGTNGQGQTNCWAARVGGLSGQPLPTQSDLVYIEHANASQDLTVGFSQPGRELLTGWASLLTIRGTAGRFAGLDIAANTLDTQRLYVGENGKGKLVQSGGVVTVGYLRLGSGTDGWGRYELSGGVLNASAPNYYDGIEVGRDGQHGEFLQTGGSASTGWMWVGQEGALLTRGDPTASSFTLNSGVSTVRDGVWVGQFRTANETFDGEEGVGSLNISGGVFHTDLLIVKPRGMVRLSGGTLSLRDLYMVASQAGNLAGSPFGLSFTGGVLEFTGLADVRLVTDGVSNVSSAFGFGGGLGGGTPTFRLAPGATLTMPSIAAGDFGKGRLEIGAGAVLTTETASVGSGKVVAIGDGAATISGAGARWNTSGALTIGSRGNASVWIGDGAVVTSGNATLGARVNPSNPQSVVRVDISGAGARWDNAGSLVIGGSETATGQPSALYIFNGGTFTHGGTLTIRPGSLLSVASPFTSQGAVVVEAGANIENSSFMRFDGPVSLYGGALVSGDGTKVFAGGLALGGDGLAEFVDGAVGANIILAASNTYFAQIGGTGLGSFDRYVMNGQFTQLILGGTLKLVSFDGYTGQSGASFDLFEGLLGGSFASIDTTGLPLAPGLSWDLSQLSSTGVVGITGVPAPIPEPAQWLLMLAGLVTLGWCARRRAAAGAGLVR